MTKELLEQYPAICIELKELERRGNESTHRQELIAKKAEIEAFQQSLPDARQRLAVYLRAMQGLSWPQVAARMEGIYSADYLRKIYRDTAKKYL